MDNLLALAKQFIEDVDKDGEIEIPEVVAALTGLMSNSGSQLDVAGLLGNIQQMGLGDVLGSWLGDGENADISADQVTALFGEEKIQAFCEQLNIDSGLAQTALSKLIPMFIDQQSSGGGLSGLLGDSADMGDVGNVLGGFLK